MDGFRRFGGLPPELEPVGTPDRVAACMGEIMAGVGSGFLISTPFQRTSRRFINEVAEGLVPALQRRGLPARTIIAAPPCATR